MSDEKALLNPTDLYLPSDLPPAQLCTECDANHWYHTESSKEFYHTPTLCDQCGNVHRPIDFHPPATAEKMRAIDEFTARQELMPKLERAVIDAALAYHESLRESTRVRGVADEFVHQYFDGHQAHLNAELLAAVDALLEARGEV
jgi:hypothetical protein